MAKERVLVTGGTGFIGVALVKKLLHKGYVVRVLDNDSRGKASRLASIKNEIEMARADIRDLDAVHKAVKDVDAVMHLAAVNGTENFYKAPELVLDVAVRGILNVIDACRKEGIERLAVASSSEVYQTPAKVPTDETVGLSIPDPLNPRYSYGGGKLISELIAINYGRSGFKQVVIFRPHNVYGPDMGWEHVLPQFIIRAKETIEKYKTGPVPFPIEGDGSQTRAFVHVDDFVDGLMIVFEKGEHLNIYHIGNPEEITIRQVAEKVVRYFGRDVKIVPGEFKAGGTNRRSPDITKLKALGFKPRISFDQGLPSIADWYAQHINERPK